MAVLRVLFRFYKKISQRLSDRSGIYLKDITNKIKYGPAAPVMYERLWVDPRTIHRMIDRDEVYRLTGLSRNEASGQVVDWSRAQNITSVYEEYRIQYCFRHWKYGESWEEIQVYDFMSQTKKYGSWPRSRIVERFAVLDNAFRETREQGRLKARNELDQSNFREKDGILVHIGIGGEVIFGGNGFHRLAIAKILELEQIPACIGLVHKESIPLLKKFRNPN